MSVDFSSASFNSQSGSLELYKLIGKTYELEKTTAKKLFKDESNKKITFANKTNDEIAEIVKSDKLQLSIVNPHEITELKNKINNLYVKSQILVALLHKDLRVSFDLYNFSKEALECPIERLGECLYSAFVRISKERILSMAEKNVEQFLEQYKKNPPRNDAEKIAYKDRIDNIISQLESDYTAADPIQANDEKFVTFNNEMSKKLKLLFTNNQLETVFTTRDGKLHFGKLLQKLNSLYQHKNNASPSIPLISSDLKKAIQSSIADLPLNMKNELYGFIYKFYQGNKGGPKWGENNILTCPQTTIKAIEALLNKYPQYKAHPLEIIMLELNKETQNRIYGRIYELSPEPKGGDEWGRKNFLTNPQITQQAIDDVLQEISDTRQAYKNLSNNSERIQEKKVNIAMTFDYNDFVEIIEIQDLLDKNEKYRRFFTKISDNPIQEISQFSPQSFSLPTTSFTEQSSWHPFMSNQLSQPQIVNDFEWPLPQISSLDDLKNYIDNLEKASGDNPKRREQLAKKALEVAEKNGIDLNEDGGLYYQVFLYATTVQNIAVSELNWGEKNAHKDLTRLKQAIENAIVDSHARMK